MHRMLAHAHEHVEHVHEQQQGAAHLTATGVINNNDFLKIPHSSVNREIIR